MKHTFVYIDKLLILLHNLPRKNLDTEAKREKVKKGVVLLSEYSDILRRLITSHRSEKYLKRLHASNIDEVEKWSEQVEDVFKKVEVLLKYLLLDTAKLVDFLEHGSENPNAYMVIRADMAEGMIKTGLHNEEEHMRKLKKIAVFEIHELEKIIDHDEHTKGLLHWIGFSHLSYREQIVEQEKFFVKLLS